jgi:hypothetical protein
LILLEASNPYPPNFSSAEIKWDRDNKTVSVQLSNVENGTVNLSIFLADDASPVTMLEGVSGHVDESKAEVNQPAALFLPPCSLACAELTAELSLSLSLSTLVAVARAETRWSS